MRSSPRDATQPCGYLSWGLAPHRAGAENGADATVAFLRC